MSCDERTRITRDYLDSLENLARCESGGTASLTGADSPAFPSVEQFAEHDAARRLEMNALQAWQTHTGDCVVCHEG